LLSHNLLHIGRIQGRVLPLLPTWPIDIHEIQGHEGRELGQRKVKRFGERGGVPRSRDRVQAIWKANENGLNGNGGHKSARFELRESAPICRSSFGEHEDLREFDIVDVIVARAKDAFSEATNGFLAIPGVFTFHVDWLGKVDQFWKERKDSLVSKMSTKGRRLSIFDSEKSRDTHNRLIYEQS